MNNEINLTTDNAIATLARLSISSKKSEKTGNAFHIMTLKFKNGLEIDYFVDKKDIFGLKDALKNHNKEKMNLEDEDNM